MRYYLLAAVIALMVAAPYSAVVIETFNGVAAIIAAVAI